MKYRLEYLYVPQTPNSMLFRRKKIVKSLELGWSLSHCLCHRQSKCEEDSFFF